MENNNQKSYGATTDEIMDFLKEHMVTKEELKVYATKEDLQAFATKEDLTEGLGKLRSDIIDFVDKKIEDLRTDFITLTRLEDRKMVALIELLATKEVLNTQEVKQLLAMEPFPRGSI